MHHSIERWTGLAITLVLMLVEAAAIWRMGTELRRQALL